MIKYPVTVEQTGGPYSLLRDADGRAIAGGISKADAADLIKLATVYEKALTVFTAYADGDGRSQAEALRDLILAVGETLPQAPEPRDVELPLPKRRRRLTKRELMAEKLKASDVTGQDRTDIIYGHYSELPQCGESVMRLGRKRSI